MKDNLRRIMIRDIYKEVVRIAEIRFEPDLMKSNYYELKHFVEESVLTLEEITERSVAFTLESLFNLDESLLKFVNINIDDPTDALADYIICSERKLLEVYLMVLKEMTYRDIMIYGRKEYRVNCSIDGLTSVTINGEYEDASWSWDEFDLTCVAWSLDGAKQKIKDQLEGNTPDYTYVHINNVEEIK